MVQEEFEKIATDIRQRVIAVARGYRLDADSAEDVAQDTMLKLWTIREKQTGGSRQRQWL
ncbi:sigma factor [uncultured Prevotella sp.]|uniref:sigma factor n=1 Tax=uncultured Prevotella sp. TaxID=159272 RepID=UPI002628E43C|nr:sigma factor [uncultured Prevotella sp.]